MNGKQIVFTQPCVAQVLTVEIPELKDDEVLVKLVCSTISAGTERANLIGDANINSTKGPSVNFPRYGGYSSAGIIEKVGSENCGFKVGDRVSCAWSTHSEYVVMKSKNVTLLPENVSFSSAAITHIATFPLAAVRKCKTEMGESAIVMGLGVLGLIAVKLLRACGATPIIAVDPIKEKRDTAIKYGADYAFDPFDPNFVQNVKSVTDGGVCVGIEVTGKGQGLDMILDCMRPRGRVALLGCTRNSDFSIDYYRKVHGPGISLIGAHTQARPSQDSYNGWWTEKDDTIALLKLISTNRLDLESMVEEVRSPLDAPAIYDRLATSPAFPVVQFDWTKLN